MSNEYVRMGHSSLMTHDSSLVVEGVLRTGLGVAAQFTELAWVREQFQRKLGLDIWPGTVNLQVQAPAGLAALARLRAGGGVPIEPPGGPPSRDARSIPRHAPNAGGEARPGDEDDAPGSGHPPKVGGAGGAASHAEGAYCVGRCFPARIGALDAAVVLPEVADYPVDKLELIAAVHVGRALGLQPGDRVTVVIEEP